MVREIVCLRVLTIMRQTSVIKEWYIIFGQCCVGINNKTIKKQRIESVLAWIVDMRNS